MVRVGKGKGGKEGQREGRGEGANEGVGEGKAPQDYAPSSSFTFSSPFPCLSLLPDLIFLLVSPKNLTRFASQTGCFVHTLVTERQPHNLYKHEISLQDVLVPLDNTYTSTYFMTC